jgi:hypothetical protein
MPFTSYEPRPARGAARAATRLLAGATPGGELVYAVNDDNRVDLAGKNGTTRTLAEGEPLDGPASLEVLDAPLRIVITNSAFGSFFTNQNPSPSLATLTLE